MKEKEGLSEGGFPWLKAAAIAVACLLGGLYFSGEGVVSRAGLLGQPAPPIEYHLAGGKSESLAENRGKVVLLNFWASWCGPCLAEMPSLRELERRMASRDFKLLLFHVEPGDGGIGDLVPPDRRPLHAISRFSRRQLEPYRIRSLPFSVLLDKQGIVRKVYHGARNWAGAGVLRDIEGLLD